MTKRQQSGKAAPVQLARLSLSHLTLAKQARIKQQQLSAYPLYLDFLNNEVAWNRKTVKVRYLVCRCMLTHTYRLPLFETKETNGLTFVACQVPWENATHRLRSPDRSQLQFSLSQTKNSASFITQITTVPFFVPYHSSNQISTTN